MKSKADARQSHLKLTAKGRAAFDPADRRQAKATGAMLGRLAPPDQARLVGAMGTIESLLGGEARADAATRAIVLEGAAPVALAVDVVDALVTVDADRIETRQAELAARPGERLKGAFAADDVDRSPFFRAGFGQGQDSGREVESGQPDLARQLGAGRSPVEPAGDHEVEDEIKVVLKAPDDALAQAQKILDRAAVERGQRGFEGADEKRTFDICFVQYLALDPRPQVFDVDGNIGELRHGVSLLLSARQMR